MPDEIGRWKPCRYCGRTGGTACGWSVDERYAHRPRALTAGQWAKVDRLQAAVAGLAAALNAPMPGRRPARHG
jgi:hypothetical protein